MSLLTELLGANDAPWMSHPGRLCAPENLSETQHADDWFAAGNGHPAIAANLCGGCPVRAVCATYAIDRPELEGIWGGLSETQRNELRAGQVA